VTGLNVEQRKRLTIGVELVAKPELLLFLDEPTSGLDSQTSWAICDLMEKLTRAGQAILCTIHQPSAMLFQRFDRLLFLASGGRTIYFGEIGENSKTVRWFSGPTENAVLISIAHRLLRAQRRGQLSRRRQPRRIYARGHWRRSRLAHRYRLGEDVERIVKLSTSPRDAISLLS
jgi:ABC-type multidrug transport system ATPase subunit